MTKHRKLGNSPEDHQTRSLKNRSVAAGDDFLSPSRSTSTSSPTSETDPDRSRKTDKFIRPPRSGPPSCGIGLRHPSGSLQATNLRNCLIEGEWAISLDHPILRAARSFSSRICCERPLRRRSRGRSCAFMRSRANAARRLSDGLAQVENAPHRAGRCVLYHATVSSIT